MEFEYRIYEEVYNDMLSGKKTIENSLNYTKEEFIKAFNNIFGEENVSKSKIVGLKIKVLY